MPFDVNPEFFLKQHGRDQKRTQKLTAFFNMIADFIIYLPPSNFTAVIHSHNTESFHRRNSKQTP